MIPTALCELLGIAFPLLQAGMGGVASPRLAAAVSDAGCGGIVALYRQPPAGVRELVGRTADATSCPFGVNLIPEVVTPAWLRDQVAAVLEHARTDVFVTFFGLPPADVGAMVRDAGRPLLIQVGTEAEAGEAIRRGAHAVIAQGTRAGGHLLGVDDTAVLLDAIHAAHPHTPLAAAGGIGSGADFAHMLDHHACGCLCGTLFVAAQESDAHAVYKQRVVEAAADDTVITDVFEIGWPGRRHRVLRSPVVDQGRALPQNIVAQSTVLGRRYWIPRFSAVVPTSSTDGRVEEMAMYCGTSCRSVDRIQSAAAIIAAFRADVHARLSATAASDRTAAMLQ